MGDHLSNPAEVRRILDSKEFFNHLHCELEVRPDGIVDINGSGSFSVTKKAVVNGRLILRFGICNAQFNAVASGIKSLENFPRVINGALSIQRNRDLVSWEGSPTKVHSMYAVMCGFTSMKGCPTVPLIDNSQNVNMNGCPLVDLDGINNISCEDLNLPYNDNMGILRVLTAPALRITLGNFVDRNNPGNSAKKATDIISEWRTAYMNGSASKNKALLACQRELMAAGLHGNARW